MVKNCRQDMRVRFEGSDPEKELAAVARIVNDVTLCISAGSVPEMLFSKTPMNCIAVKSQIVEGSVPDKLPPETANCSIALSKLILEEMVPLSWSISSKKN